MKIKSCLDFFAIDVAAGGRAFAIVVDVDGVLEFVILAEDRRVVAEAAFEAGEVTCVQFMIACARFENRLWAEPEVDCFGGRSRERRKLHPVVMLEPKLFVQIIR